jgi:transcriptional regulator with XRE-family HTH domain
MPDMSDYEDPIDGEVLPEDASPFDIAFGQPRGPRPGIDVGETYSAPSLGQILTQYNEMLGWRQSDLAKAVGKDTAEISRIVTGKHRRPQDATLELFAQAYQAAGLQGVTQELLQAARDNQDKPVTNPWGLPPHFLRLVQAVLAHDQEFQDATYRKWSTDLRETAMLVARKRIDE